MMIRMFRIVSVIMGANLLCWKLDRDIAKTGKPIRKGKICAGTRTYNRLNTYTVVDICI